MVSRDTFSSCHPSINFLYFGLVLLFTMCFDHPLARIVSLAGALCYALYLNGRKAATGRNDGLGRIVFAGVRLQEGDNTVRVVSGALSDECVWNLDSTRTEEQVTPSERLDGAVD